MIKLYSEPVVLTDTGLVPAGSLSSPQIAKARELTLSYNILQSHNTSAPDEKNLKLRFDAMASHDITYVGIIQTARAGSMTEFPLPYVLTNCHNSLCAVGGTINEDDHLFGLSAARKYGGEYVPPHQAVVHQYMRERYAGSGKMILASDSHTRYGPYGTLAIGEGGPELVKQLLGRTYDIPQPLSAAIWLTGTLNPGVGPQDVALALIKEVFPSGFVKNKILEFMGPGVDALSMDMRNGIDVMTTETTCLSTVWRTDKRVFEELSRFGRPEDYKPMSPETGAYYDCGIIIELDKIEPMIALPFHPSNVYAIDCFSANAGDILRGVEREAESQWGIKTDLVSGLIGGKLRVEQGVIAGCSGGLAQNIRAARNILKGCPIGDGEFSLSVYPASQPMMISLTKDGTLADLMESGAVIRSAFCGPCFGAGDVPASGGFSIRHTTRNFPNREGSKPQAGQTAFTALMDARSIAATASRGGILTPASLLEPTEPESNETVFYDSPYKSRVYCGYKNPQPDTQLRLGPNITDWPEFLPLPEDMTLTIAAAIYDSVTTTDELIPSGDTSSYRSNPAKLAEFTLSRKDPDYVGRCKKIGYPTAVCALRPGDGSAREQAASCQRVLGGVANIALEYATKRYRSNLINWGMLPFIWEDLERERPAAGDTIKIIGLRSALLENKESFSCVWTHGSVDKNITLKLPGLTSDERDIILSGCLMNYYAGVR